MNIQTGHECPERVTYIRKLGMKQRTINFDIEEIEEGVYQWASVTLGLGDWGYDKIVSAIIYAKYDSNQIEAINLNIIRVMFDSDSLSSDKIEEYRNEAMELQMWRDHAKLIAREIIDSEPDC